MTTPSKLPNTEKIIKVMLISPRLPPSHNRYSGDNGYTDTFLQCPPPGVRYYHYEDLMATGQVRKIHHLYHIGPRLVKWGVLPPDLWAEYLVSDFVPDILHIYGFSAVVRFPKSSQPIPVLLGNGTASYSDLKYYLGWNETRIRLSRWLKRQYLRAIDAYDSSLRPESADHVHVWSQFSQKMHLDEGFVRPNQIEVLYPALPWRGDDGNIKRNGTDGFAFLFIGRDFKRKNGDLVLDTFRQVRSLYPNVKLILVGIPEDGQTISEAGVTHYHFLPRQELLERIYPQADVLVLPSKAEGFGLVLLEAMSYGIPVIGMNAWAMPEVIEDGVNGFLLQEDSKADLAEKMKQLAEAPELLKGLQQGARRVFQKKFAISVHNNRLKEIYDAILVQGTAAQVPSLSNKEIISSQ